MPAAALQLPILQNWSCHNCGGCCRDHAIYITPQERDRIISQKWTPESGVPAGQPLFREERSWLSAPKIRLEHQPDGGCVFLDAKGLCRIHGKFGEAAKPLACRIYPYAFHPVGDQLTVSLRFSCPSVADNLGKPVEKQQRDLQTLVQLVVPQGYRAPDAPKLTRTTRLNWDDTMIMVQSLDESLAADDTPLSLQLLRMLFWVGLVEQARFTKISGTRLEELLQLLRDGSVAELPELPVSCPTPSSVGLTQFRLLAGQYARKDTEGSIDTSWRGRAKLLKSAVSLTKGTGNLPELSDKLKSVPVARLSEWFGPLPERSQEMLRRFLRVKIQGLHFCGKACYDNSVIEGIQALVLTYPAILWIAKWRATSDSREEWRHEDIRDALNLVDHQHGYSPVFGTWGARLRVKNLLANDDLQKLIVWADGTLAARG